jgi:uncharacterized membrane protein
MNTIKYGNKETATKEDGLTEKEIREDMDMGRSACYNMIMELIAEGKVKLIRKDRFKIYKVVEKDAN